MTTPADIARSAAGRLADTAPALAAHVEARLHAGEAAGGAERYFDADLAIKLAGLVVATASLALNIYNTLKKSKPSPAPADVARQVRVQVAVPPGVGDAQADRVIAVVVEETVRQAGTQP